MSIYCTNECTETPPSISCTLDAPTPLSIGSPSNASQYPAHDKVNGHEERKISDDDVPPGARSPPCSRPRTPRRWLAVSTTAACRSPRLPLARRSPPARTSPETTPTNAVMRTLSSHATNTLNGFRAHRIFLKNVPRPVVARVQRRQRQPPAPAPRTATTTPRTTVVFSIAIAMHIGHRAARAARGSARRGSRVDAVARPPARDRRVRRGVLRARLPPSTPSARVASPSPSVARRRRRVRRSPLGVARRAVATSSGTNRRACRRRVATPRARRSDVRDGRPRGFDAREAPTTVRDSPTVRRLADGS